MKVENNTVVSLHYVMKNEAGEILDENMQSAPVEYIHGIGKILPVLERSLGGMSAGDKKSISFEDAQITGLIHMDVVVKDVRVATEDELNNGAPKKDDCAPDCCC